MMTYCNFSKDGEGIINGVHVVKQVVLVSFSLPLRLTLLNLDQRTALRNQVYLRNDPG